MVWKTTTYLNGPGLIIVHGHGEEQSLPEPSVDYKGGFFV